jgi:hypothetical protein
MPGMIGKLDHRQNMKLGMGKLGNHAKLIQSGKKEVRFRD